MRSQFTHFALLCAITVLPACTGGEDSVSPTPPPAETGGAGAVAEQTPKQAIAHQFELLKAGKVDELRACFTDRQKGRITAENVAKGQKEAGSMALADLVDSVELGEFEGKQTAKIKMKNGRSLTTLVKSDAGWLADTVWFK